MAKSVQALPTPGAGDGRLSVVSLSAPKRRRMSWMLAGVGIVVLAGLIGAFAFTLQTKTISVYVASHDLAPGDVLSDTDIRLATIGASSEGLRAVQPADRGLLVGQSARGAIPGGTVLNIGLVASKSEVIPADMVVVGAALDPGAIPAGVVAGDRVVVLSVAGQTAAGAAPEAASVITSATVWAAPAIVATGSKQVVSLLVPEAMQVQVAQAAADGRLRLSLVGVSK
jgi:SAF domain